jgi:GTPase SAR1 family protein
MQCNNHTKVRPFTQIPPERKLLLIGLPGVGKTTLRMTFFEGEDPEQLMRNPPLPTRGRKPETRNYRWIDLQVYTWDCGGQNLDRWHGDEEYDTFAQTDAIIYMVEPSTDKDNPLATDATKELDRLLDSARKYNGHTTRLFILIHKTDLIPANRKEHVISSIQTALRNIIEARTSEADFKEAKFYATSLLDGSAFSALRDILNTLTPTGIRYQTTCENIIRAQHQGPASSEEALIEISEVMMLHRATGYLIAYSTTLTTSTGNQYLRPQSPRALSVIPLTELIDRAIAELGGKEDTALLLILVGRNQYYVLTKVGQDFVLAMLMKPLRAGDTTINVRTISNLLNRSREMLHP